MIYPVKKEVLCHFPLWSHNAVIWRGQVSHHCIVFKMPQLSTREGWSLTCTEYYRDLSWHVIKWKRYWEKSHITQNILKENTFRIDYEIFSVCIFLLKWLKFVAVVVCLPWLHYFLLYSEKKRYSDSFDKIKKILFCIGIQILGLVSFLSLKKNGQATMRTKIRILRIHTKQLTH